MRVECLRISEHEDEDEDEDEEDGEENVEVRRFGAWSSLFFELFAMLVLFLYLVLYGNKSLLFVV